MDSPRIAPGSLPGVLLFKWSAERHSPPPFPTMSDTRKPFPFKDFEPQWQLRWALFLDPRF